MARSGLVSPGGGASVVLQNTNKYPFLHLALAAVLNKNADTKLCIVGDSNSTGYNVKNQLGSADIIANLLTAAGIPAAVGLTIPTNPNTVPVGTDARAAFGTGWALGGTGQVTSWGGLGPIWQGAVNAAGNLVFTPTSGATYDSYDIYYISATGGVIGTATATVAGGGTATMNGNAGNGVFRATTSAGTAAANQALTISTATSGGTILGAQIVGVEPFLSTTRRVRVGVASVNGAATSNWVTAAALSNGPLNCITAYQAGTGAAFLMELGLDDLFITGTSQAGVQANYATLAAAMNTSALSSVTGMSIVPANAPGLGQSNGAMAAYVNNLKSWCANNGAGYIDLFTPWGGANGFNTMPGAYYSDAIGHPSALGLADIGRLIVTQLLAL